MTIEIIYIQYSRQSLIDIQYSNALVSLMLRGNEVSGTQKKVACDSK